MRVPVWYKKGRFFREVGMKKPVKIILGILVAIILGSGIGYGTAVWAFEAGATARDVINGPWRTNLGAGSEEASLYTRAWIAVHGLLALRSDETIYYGAYTDDDGKPLTGDNVYRIEGNAIDARWWSITLYGSDDFLIPNELNLYSYSGNTVAMDSNGKFTIYVSKAPKPGNWLPLGNEKKFGLSLRVYNPGESVRKNPATVQLPHIIREVNK
jgi:hypothetical protein